MQSLSGRYLDVPEDFYEVAAHFVSLIIKQELTLLKELPENHPFYCNRGVYSKAVSLLDNPDSKALRDEVFLRVCVKLHESKGVLEGRSEDFDKLDQHLMEMRDELLFPRIDEEKLQS